MITHVVSFKLGDPVADADDLKARLDALPAAIPEIKSLVVGVNIVPSARAHDVVLIGTYDDLEALRRYQEHPAHLPVVEFIQERCTTVTAVDFES